MVIASKPDAFGLERARRHGIPAIAVPRKLHRDVGAFNDALHAELARFDVDLVVLLGFLSPFETRGRFDGRAINVHPALVPAFSGRGYYGHRVHEAVIESGVKLRARPSTSSTGSTTTGRSSCRRPSRCATTTRRRRSPSGCRRSNAGSCPRRSGCFAQGRLRIEGRRVRHCASAPRDPALALDQLDLVAVRILDEGDHGAAVLHRTRLAGDPDALARRRSHTAWMSSTPIATCPKASPSA